eukprot:TRINITY_DN4102_c0_g1_i1.p1 TRINITY_DN4102_c0_g1~~TRINITY_DN4102_c0_g1_i1.p1  ORF type:complete len:239 (+),score=27.51 TRINITY_DN4102_c0_g1_i1:73-789(+)
MDLQHLKHIRQRRQRRMELRFDQEDEEDTEMEETLRVLEKTSNNSQSEPQEYPETVLMSKSIAKHDDFDGDEEEYRYDSADEFSESEDPPFLDQFPAWLLKHRRRYHRSKSPYARRTYRNALRLYVRERAERGDVTFAFDAWSRRRAPPAQASSKSDFQLDDTAEANPSTKSRGKTAMRSAPKRLAASTSHARQAPRRRRKKPARRGDAERDSSFPLGSKTSRLEIESTLAEGGDDNL